MEFNKTSEALYSCNTPRQSHPEASPAPVDNRDVKVFSLETKQVKDTQRSSSKDRNVNHQDRKETHSSDDKRCESTGETREEEKDEDKVFVANSMAAELLFADKASVASAQTLEAAPITVASADLQWVSETILSTVESMMISGIDNQQLVEIVLEQNGEVPAAFAGANLTLVQTGSDLSVKFSNFVDPMQAANALELVVANPAQLSNLVEALKGRQLNLTEFAVGSSIVQLPTVEETQTPLHMIAAAIRHHDQEKDQDQQDRQQPEQQEENVLQVEEARL